MAAGPYAYILSVFRETLPTQHKFPQYAIYYTSLMQSYTPLAMYLLGTVLFYATVATIRHMRDNVTIWRIIEPCTDYRVVHLTNIVYTMTVTTLMTHVSGPNEPFVIILIIITIRVQQTLSYIQDGKPFNGPISMLVVIIQGFVWSQSEPDTNNEEDKYSCILKGPNTENVHWFGIMILCVMLGMATQAHSTRIVLTSLTDICKKDTNTIWISLVTWGIHVIFVSTLTGMATYTQFFTHICGNTYNNGFIHLLGFVLTITNLLLSMAPTKKTFVYGILTGDTAAVCAAMLITLRYPASGTIAIITIYIIHMILLTVMFPICTDYTKEKQMLWMVWLTGKQIKTV